MYVLCNAISFLLIDTFTHDTTMARIFNTSLHKESFIFFTLESEILFLITVDDKLLNYYLNECLQILLLKCIYIATNIYIRVNDMIKSLICAIDLIESI